MYSWKTVLVTVILLFSLKVSSPYIVENIQWSWFDYLHQSHEIEQVPDFVLVDIDEKAIEQYGQYPWPRDVYAELMWNTDPSNVHVFTQIFSEEDRFGGDEIFAEALINRLSILAAAPTTQTQTGLAPFVGTATLGGGAAADYVWNFPGIISPLPILQANTYGVGVTNATPNLPGTPNFDATVRSAPLLVNANDQLYPSLVLETIRAFFDETSYQLRVTPDIGVEWVRMGRQPPLATTPTGDVLISYWNEFPRVSASDLVAEDLGGKVYIWGLTAEGFNNPVSTPVGAMFPHEVQANLLQTVLNQTIIKKSYWYDLLALVVLLSAMLKVLFVTWKAPTRFALIGVGVLVGGQVYAGFYLWNNYLILFDTFYSAISSLLVFAHASFNKYYLTYKEKERIKKQFEGYCSPTVVKLLQENPDIIKKGTKREISILFSDLRGFTPLGESFGDDVQGLTKLMNGYMDAITQPVLNADGMIIKYIGDASMHVHNAPNDDPNHARSAVQTGIEMLRAVEEFNIEVKRQGRPPVGMGAGINTGIGYLGEMGSTSRHSYDVLGDSVSTAARIESKCKEYGCLLLVGDATYQKTKDDFFYLKVDDLAVKGKSVGIGIYTVLDAQEKAEEWYDAQVAHEEMHELYRAQKFDEAIALCKKLETAFDQQMRGYYSMWIERCEFQKTQDLPEDWNGVFIATTK